MVLSRVGAPRDVERSRTGSAKRLRWLRWLCHLAAELPFVVMGALELARGWRPVSDDAMFAWRALNVFSAHPTLLGEPSHVTTAGARNVFAPGPLLSWLQAVPVHLDPIHGILWASTLLAVLGVALAIEAAWAAAGGIGALLCTAAVLTLMTTRVDVLLYPVWTPWIGALWLVTTVTAAWAVGCGHRRWWPVLVFAASFCAQCHVVFLLPCVGVSAVALVGGFRRELRALAHRHLPGAGAGRTLLAGVAVGFVVWLPTLVEQVFDRPGNLDLIVHASRHGDGHVGFKFALRGFGSATSVPPSWAHRLLDSSSFVRVLIVTVGTSAWWGAVTLSAVAAVAAVAVAAAAGRHRRLAAASWVVLAVSVLSVLTVATTPRADAVQLDDYLSVIYWPVGMAASLVIAAGVVGLLRSLTGRARSALPGAWRQRAVAALRRAAVPVAAAAVVLGGMGATWSALSLGSNSQSEFGGAVAVKAATAATTAIERVAPRRPYLVLVTGRSSPSELWGVYWGVVYALAVSGQPVRLPPNLGPFVGTSAPTGEPHREVVVVLRHGSIATARVVHLGEGGLSPGPAGREA